MSAVHCFGAMTAPFCCRYLALTSIKYQTLPLQVSNAGGLE